MRRVGRGGGFGLVRWVRRAREGFRVEEKERFRMS